MRIRSILVNFSVAVALTGQVTREHSLVMKNWPAPLYWQPSQIESEAAGVPRATPAVALIFVAMTPCRVVDTRASQMFAAPFGSPGLTAGPARSFPIQSSTLCSIPAVAQAYSFNVTVVPPGVLGYLTIFPHGQPQPNAVTLDDLLGTIVNNAAIVAAGTVNGSVDVVVNGNTDLVLDINGYYAVPNPALNTTTGLNALVSNTTGSYNTASGYRALFSNTTGNYNTANGGSALDANTSGQFNTATGYSALFHNTTGGSNTAIGSYALLSNTTGGSNTGTGYNALVSNTTGSNNVASGTSALTNNTTGSDNTASGGYGTLYNNTFGHDNIATGSYALFGNTYGDSNTASGSHAMYGNITGIGNTASGYGALYNPQSGNYNIAVGYGAGNFVTGSNNIDLASQGSAGDNGVTRIGATGYQNFFYAAGIRGVITGQADAMPVLIDSNGQLGTASSSRRFKEDIQDMADSSAGLLRLRPVTYRYQRPYGDGAKPIDYGLIAEEVAEVFPDLVVKGSDGQIETVQYQKLTPMLLNELQKQQAQIAALQKTVETLLTGRSALPITQ